MSKLHRSLVIGLLFVLASGVGWFALRDRRTAEPKKISQEMVPLSPVKANDPSAEAFHMLVSARAGQITAGDVAKQRALLLNRSVGSRGTLERALRSSDPFERLLAFRLLLDLDGWSPQLSADAFQDSFVLLRVEAADWLYLARRFDDWDAFLSASAKNGAPDYTALKPAVRNLRWRGLPAGAELLGIGHGIDRYYRELLRRSDAAASVAENDLSTATSSPLEQQPLVRLLHEANRSDYESFLRKLLTRTAEDTPARFEAIWLLGQGFATAANRDLLVQHLAANAGDPLRFRVEQALASVNEQLSLGSDRLTEFEARLAVAQQSGPPAAIGAALVAVLDESLRVSRVTDKTLLEAARQVLPAQPLDYAARRRLADIDFLIQRSK
jgi:hypothetical protein